MEITCRVAPDAERRRRTLAYLWRRGTVVTAVGTPLFIAGGVAWTVGSFGLSAIGKFLVGYWVVAGIYIAWAYVRRMRRLASATPPRSANVDITYTATEAFWRLTSIYATSEFSWRRYTRVVELADQFVFMESRRTAHVLPKAGLSAADLATLRTFFTGLNSSTAPPIPAWQPPIGPGMRIQVHAPFDLRLRTAGLRHVLRRVVRRVIMLWAFYIVLGVLLIAVDPTDLLTDAALGLIVAWGVFRIIGALTWAGRLARNTPARLRTDTLLTLTDSGFYFSGELARSAMRWESFVGTHELPGQILLMLARDAFHSIPTGALSPEDLQTLRTFLANRDWRVALRPVQPEPAGQ